MQLLKASKRGKLPIVGAGGELLALATRALFREDARMPFGGGLNRGGGLSDWVNGGVNRGVNGGVWSVARASLEAEHRSSLAACSCVWVMPHACQPPPLPAAASRCPSQTRVASRPLSIPTPLPPPTGPASVAPDGRLLVGAAVGTRDADRERVAALRWVLLGVWSRRGDLGGGAATEAYDSTCRCQQAGHKVAVFVFLSVCSV